MSTDKPEINESNYLIYVQFMQDSIQRLEEKSQKHDDQITALCQQNLLYAERQTAVLEKISTLQVMMEKGLKEMALAIDKMVCRIQVLEEKPTKEHENSKKVVKNAVYNTIITVVITALVAFIISGKLFTGG